MGKEKKKDRWASDIGSVFQIKIFHMLIKIGGWKLAYFILHFVVLYYIILRPSVRRKCRYYLSHRFPGEGKVRRLISSYRLSVELGKVLIDRAIVGVLGIKEISVAFKDRQKLIDLISEGKGIILLMAHAGCWQVALSALQLMKIKVNMLIRKDEGDMDRHYFEHGPARSHYRIIDPGGFLGGALEMISALKNGEALCIMGDRPFGEPSNNVAVEFLGEKALFPVSAMRLSSVSGAPVVILYTYKTGATSCAIDLAGVIRVSPGLGRNAENFLPYMKEFIESLHGFTKEYPFQFFNFYDMWERP